MEHVVDQAKRIFCASLKSAKESEMLKIAKKAENEIRNVSLNHLHYYFLERKLSEQ